MSRFLSSLPWLVAVAAIAMWWFKPNPPPVYRNVEVPVETIVEVERVDTVVRWRERIVYREAEPEQVATAPEGAVGLVQSFCSPTLADAQRTSGGNDTLATPVRPLLLLRSIRTDPGWFWRPDKVVLTGPLSTGDLRQLTYTVRPGWRAHVRGDGVLMQEPRFGLARELIEAAVYIGTGVVVGKLVW